MSRERLPHIGILVLSAVAEFVLTLDLSIVNVALPAIGADLGFSPDSLPWVVNGYALTFGGFLLLGGRAADLFGGRRVFCVALTVFTLASLGAALAPGPGALVAARVVQGIGASVLAATTLSILTATFQEPAQRRRALAIWTAVAIGGGAAGGLVGGVLTAALSWRWIFFVNAPVGAVLLAYAVARLPRPSGQTGRDRLDIAGAVTATAGLTALVWALARAEVLGWGSAEVLVGLATAAVLLITFVAVEAWLARVPVMPLQIFASRLIAAGNMLSLLSFIPVPATWYLLSLYLQGIRGFRPAEVGLWFAPMSLAVVGGSLVGFRLAARIDARVLFSAGGLVGAAGLAWLGSVVAGGPVVWVIVAATLAMAGGGLMFAPVTVAATAGSSPEQSGLASGLLNTTRQIGGAIGLAVLGTLAATRAGTEGGAAPALTSAGAGAAFTVGAVILFGAAVVGALALPSRLSPPESDAGQHRLASAGVGSGRR